MKLIDVPTEFLPVVRRWREDRTGLSYLPGSHVIILQEDLSPADLAFVMCHEGIHSRLFGCALGFFITSLTGIEYQLAHKGMKLIAEGADRAATEQLEPKAGFYSRKPRRADEFPELPDWIRTHLAAIGKTDRFRSFVKTYLEVRRRRAFLIGEWRFLHEGIATLVEFSLLREIDSLGKSCATWGEVLGLPVAQSDFDYAIRRVGLRLIPILEPGTVSPDTLIHREWTGLDPYIDGARFLFHNFSKLPGGIPTSTIAQLASQIPYGMLPGLDDSFEEFRRVATNACSPTARLGRLAKAFAENDLQQSSFAELLPYALDPSDRAAADATDGYYAWEQKAIHTTDFLSKEIEVQNKTARLPYGKTTDQVLYKNEPNQGGQVLVVYNDKAFPCNLEPSVWLTPLAPTDGDVQFLTLTLRGQLQAQSFERVVESMIAWGDLVDDRGRPFQWA